MEVSVTKRPVENCFGIHTSRSPLMKDDEGKSFAKISNIANPLSWIPGVTAIVGIARLAFMCYILFSQGLPERPEDKAFAATWIMRGVVETLLPLGLLTLVPDIIFTVGRYIENAPQK